VGFKPGLLTGGLVVAVIAHGAGSFELPFIQRDAGTTTGRQCPTVPATATNDEKLRNGSSSASAMW
jgi:hypothetical protein